MNVHRNEREQGSGPESERTNFRLERADFRLERADFRPEKSWGGQKDRMTDEQTDEQKFPCVLKDFVPFGAAAQKKKERKMVRKKGIKVGRIEIKEESKKEKGRKK